MLASVFCLPASEFVRLEMIGGVVMLRYMTASSDFRLDLTHRPRRMRRTTALRALANETDLHVHNLIQPIFVIDGEGAAEPIESMPGISRLTIPLLIEECRQLAVLGIAVLGIGVLNIEVLHIEVLGIGALSIGMLGIGLLGIGLLGVGMSSIGVLDIEVLGIEVLGVGGSGVWEFDWWVLGCQVLRCRIVGV